MDRFGEYLRTAREAREIPLTQISESTHISVRLLEALENDRFDVLPGGVLIISFVRQYARIVGLDEEEAVGRLKQVARPVESALGEWSKRTGESDDTYAKLAELVTDFVRSHRLTLLGGLATVALLASGFVFFQANESWRQELSSRPVEIDRSVPDNVAEPVSTSSAARERVVASREPASSGERAGSANPIRLELRLTERAWVRVVADGERVLEDNLEAGFVQTIRARESVQLVVGNAGGVSVALNGESMTPIGPAGHVRRVDVSASGMEVVNIEPKPAADSEPSDTISETD
jgi:cytoskeletal protein RodZ